MASYTDTFTASAQYNDWKGSAAADNSDHKSIHDLLEEQGLITENDFLLAFSFWSGEGSLFIRAFVLEGADNYENAQGALELHDPIPVKRADLKITMEQFFELFKRFDIVLCSSGLKLDGRQFVTND
jgi:hypothetical protein